jgi:hypothetical protein
MRIEGMGSSGAAARLQDSIRARLAAQSQQAGAAKVAELAAHGAASTAAASGAAANPAGIDASGSASQSGSTPAGALPTPGAAEAAAQRIHEAGEGQETDGDGDDAAGQGGAAGQSGGTAALARAAAASATAAYQRTSQTTAPDAAAASGVKIAA